MNLEANKNEFITICKSSINRPGIEELLEWIETTDFYFAPASTKYHLNIPGGLCKHSLNVYYNILHLYDVLKFKKYTLKLTEEELAIVSLFHDFCKINFYKEETRNKKNEYGVWEKYKTYAIKPEGDLYGHGYKSSRIVSKFMELTDKEYMAITHHMGFSGEEARINPSIVSEVFNNNALAVLLNMADMVSTFLDERDDINGNVVK